MDSKMALAAGSMGAVLGLAVGFVSKREKYYVTDSFIGWLTYERTMSDAIAWCIGGIVFAIATAYLIRRISN